MEEEEGVIPRTGTLSLDAVSDAERGVVLNALLREHPEWRPEAEAMAGKLLLADNTQIADAVTGTVLGLRFGTSGGRIPEMLADTVRPYLEDMTERARLGASSAAREIACGVLFGLYDCRYEDDKYAVLAPVDLVEAIDDLAQDVVRRMREERVRIPVLTDECPEWNKWLYEYYY
jgi:hypothetical protein